MTEQEPINKRNSNGYHSAEYTNGFVPLTSLNGLPIEKPEFTGQDHELLGVKQSTFDLIGEIKAAKPKRGIISGGARTLGSNFHSG